MMVSNDETEDVDEDGLIEKLENANGLSDFNPDFDNDGFDDLTELNAGTNPKDPSSVPLRANQPPTILFLSSVEISENSPLSTRVGILSVVDSDENEIHQFKLTGKFPDNAHFKISDNELLTNSVFDFENKDLYLIHITVVDSRRRKSMPFQILVNDLPEYQPPENILLLPSEIAENKIAGSVVGQIRVIDPNLSDNHEIKILGGLHFDLLEDGRLISSEIFDYELKSYPISIEAIDPSGARPVKDFTVKIRDVFENMPIEDMTLDSNQIEEMNRLALT